MSKIEPTQRHPLHSTAAILEATLKNITLSRPDQPAVRGSGKLRPIIVYGLSDMRAACQAALEQGSQELAVLSPSGVAHSLGPQWFKHLLSAAQQSYAELRIIGIMDCGPYEGHVMNALNSGMHHVYFQGDDEIAEKLGWIAAKSASTIHRGFAEILDLKGEGDQLAACRKWLAAPAPARPSATA